MIAEIIVVILTLIIYLSVSIKRYHDQYGKGLFSPEMYPVIGNFHLFYNKSE